MAQRNVKVKVALAVAAIAAVAVAATVLWVRSDGSSGISGPYLTADDVPSGYQVSQLPNTAPSGIGGTTMPSECGPVISGQVARQMRASTPGVLATPDDSTKPTFAQSVITGGESVADTVGVVRRCPSYRQQTDTETFESSSSILSTPSGCPRDAVVIRARTRYSSASEQSDTTSVTAYVQGRNVVGVLTTALARAEAPISDDFCRLTTLVARRLE
ncbi:hypothetical protein [Williamsia sp. M5A3_1d]